MPELWNFGHTKDNCYSTNKVEEITDFIGLRHYRRFKFLPGVQAGGWNNT